MHITHMREEKEIMSKQKNDSEHKGIVVIIGAVFLLIAYSI